MKNVKINLDRPPIDSKSIQANKDFDSLMKNHAIMSKPFYKSTWFLGTTGIASIGLVIGGIISFNPSNDELAEDVILDNSAPPEISSSENHLIALNSEVIPKTTNQDLVKDTFKFLEHNSTQLDDNTNTLDLNISQNNSNNDELSNDNQEIVDVLSHEDKHDEVQDDVKENIDFTAMMPRIGGKINGSISRDELFDNKGITTESDVSVIHFELHLIDGLGGEVLLEEESNQLNDEMKAALKKINQGETIYFENIKGRTGNGEIVRLNPLRYVLMN